MKHSKLSEFLSQPYPFYYRGINLTIIGSIIFSMAFVFNYFFQPFDVHVPEHKMDYFWISLIHSFTPIVIFLFWLPVVILSPRIEEKWNIGREILFAAVFLFLVGLVQFLIRDIIYDNSDNWSFRYFFEEIRNTFMVGVLFILILVPLNYNRLNNLNIKNAKGLYPHPFQNKNSIGSSEIAITTQVKNDDFLLNVDHFIYAQAERNYVELYLKKDTKSEKLLKRITITDLQNQLHHFPYIFKSHRSYLVNLHQVEDVLGNAQGYKLRLRDTPTVIPVSRIMIPSFEDKIQQL